MPPKRDPDPDPVASWGKCVKAPEAPSLYEYQYSFENDEEKVPLDPHRLTNANWRKGIPSWTQLQRDIYDEPSFLAYMTKEYPVLRIPTHCGRCQRLLQLPNKGLVRCSKKQCKMQGQWSQSIYKFSFFQEAKVEKHLILAFLWLWLTQSSSTQIEMYLRWSSDTAFAWTKAIQDVIATVVLNDQEKVGGHGIVVEIDESKFGKRKYQIGHRVEGAWVFGGVELTPERKMFSVIVEDRTKATLHAVIKKHILPGSVIRSDCWSAYVNLNNPDEENLSTWLPEMNYGYECVNHSVEYVTEDGVHTNTIEGTWFAIKRSVPVRKRTKKLLQGCLFEFHWRRRNEGNLWNGLMRALVEVLYERVHPRRTPLDGCLGSGFYFVVFHCDIVRD